jgi:hypothetical protein
MVHADWRLGAEGGFKLDLRQDRDSGKQKLKGAVRTETYQCHYCQHSSLFFVKEGGRCVRSGFFELARGGVGEGRVSWQKMLGW